MKTKQLLCAHGELEATCAICFVSDLKTQLRECEEVSSFIKNRNAEILEQLRECEKQLEKAEHRLKVASEISKLQQQQLEKAEEVIRFYSVEACNEDWCERYLPEYDEEIIDYLSGKRARNYLKEKDK